MKTKYTNLNRLIVKSVQITENDKQTHKNKFNLKYNKTYVYVA